MVDARSVEKRLDAAALSGLHIPARVSRVLFLTTNSALWDDPRFVEDFVALTADAAAALIGRGVRLVGIDYLSIAPYQDPHLPMRCCFVRVSPSSRPSTCEASNRALATDLPAVAHPWR